MFDLALSPDGKSVLAGSSDTTIFQWRLINPSLAELRAWVEQSLRKRVISAKGDKHLKACSNWKRGLPDVTKLDEFNSRAAPWPPAGQR